MFLNVLVIAVFFSSINVFSQSAADSTLFSTPRGEEVGAKEDFMPIAKSVQEDGYITVIDPFGKFLNVKKENVVQESGNHKGAYVQVRKEDGSLGLISEDKLISANRVVVVPFLGTNFKYLVAAKDAKLGTKEKFTFDEAYKACKEYSEIEDGSDKGAWSVPDRIVLFGIYNIYKNETDSVFKNSFISKEHTDYYWSSTSEYNANNAWRQYFRFGNQNINSKGVPGYVRCARAL